MWHILTHAQPWLVVMLGFTLLKTWPWFSWVLRNGLQSFCYVHSDRLVQPWNPFNVIIAASQKLILLRWEIWHSHTNTSAMCHISIKFAKLTIYSRCQKYPSNKCVVYFSVKWILIKNIFCMFRKRICMDDTYLRIMGKYSQINCEIKKSFARQKRKSEIKVTLITFFFFFKQCLFLN